MVRNCTTIRKKYKSKIIGSVCLLLAFLGFTLCSFKCNSALADGEKSSFIVIEMNSKRVFKAENEHKRLPMASTTKAMTAIVTIENSNLDDVVTVPKEAVGIEGSSIYLKQGQKLTVRELLYGLMLRSGNDASVALAIHTAGSIEKFVELMNKKAIDLGLKNTCFINPHGLSAKGHYTSAYDLALIATYGMQNPIFKDIVSTKLYTIKGENNEENIYFANKNRILYNYSGGNGVKTGYTKEAGRCLIASSEKNGMQVIAVALNHYNYFELCSNLMDYAHENYELKKVIDAEKIYANVKVKKGGKTKSADLKTSQNVFYPLKKDGTETVREEINTVELITAPHYKETSCGEVKIYINNHLKFSEKLYTIDIEKKFSIF